MSANLQAAGATDLARECLYRYLSAALSDPRTQHGALARDPENQWLARVAARLLRERGEAEGGPLGFGEAPLEQLNLRPVLPDFQKPVAEQAAEYDRAFGLVLARECPPYETEYHPDSEPFYRSQQLADVAGFYRAFGLEPAHEGRQRPDYLPLELEFMAFLGTKVRLAETEEAGGGCGVEHALVCVEAQREFFRDHVAWWVPAFAAGLRRRAGSGPYAALAQVLAAFVTCERRHFGLPAPRMTVPAVPAEKPEEHAGCGACAGYPG
jgi:TorA maturation chaperone TorD